MPTMLTPLKIRMGQVVVQPWPAISTPQPGLMAAPEDDHMQHWLRYCFVDEESAKALYELLLEAIARWEPAMQVSSLRIVPDFFCMGDFRCICESPGVSDAEGTQPNDDAMQISLLRGKGAAMGTGTSVGWAKYELSVLEFGWLLTGRELDYGENRQVLQKDRARIALTHELGHAIGLFHEHERPDAIVDNRIYYDCFAFDEYAGVRARVEREMKANYHGTFAKDMPLDARMEEICCDYGLAVRYGFNDVHAYMAKASFIDPISKKEVPFVSNDYDYRSMMHYSSHGVRPFFLRHQDRVDLKKEVNFISMGGTVFWKLKSISVLDIQRVAQLYPPTPGHRQAAEAKLSKWIKAGKFDPTEYVLTHKQKEIWDIIKKDKNFPDSVQRKKLAPFSTMVQPAPTDAFQQRLVLPYRLEKSMCASGPRKPVVESRKVVDLDQLTIASKGGSSGGDAGEGSSKPQGQLQGLKGKGTAPA